MSHLRNITLLFTNIKSISLDKSEFIGYNRVSLKKRGESYDKSYKARNCYEKLRFQ